MLMQNVTPVSWKREKKNVSFAVIYFECDLYSLQANIYLRGKKKCNYNVQMAKTLLQIYCEGRKNVLLFYLAGDLFFCYVRAPLCGYLVETHYSLNNKFQQLKHKLPLDIF